jgi:hypothetical protein
MSRHQILPARLLLLSGAVLLGASVLSGTAAAQDWRSGGPGVTVFADKNFRGASATFRTDTPDLRPYRLNDKISSLQVPPGESWEMCQDINYRNRCEVFSTSVSDLRPMGWNHKISSLRRIAGGYGANRGDRSGVYNDRSGVYNSPAYSPGIVVYGQPGFRGGSRVLTGPANLGFFSRGRSVQVQSGTWELCDGSGRCTAVRQSVPDVSRLGLGGISSVRPIDNYRGNDRDRDDGYRGNNRDRDDSQGRYYGR